MTKVELLQYLEPFADDIEVIIFEEGNAYTVACPKHAIDNYSGMTYFALVVGDEERDVRFDS